jgi:PAS domain S-box-containing protein
MQRLNESEDPVVPQALSDPRLCRAILDHFDEGVYMVDRDRRIVYWNRAAEEITGYRQHEVVGCCCAAGLLMHADEDGTVLCTGSCPLEQVMEDGVSSERTLTLKHKDGFRLPVRVRAMAIRDAAAGCAGAVEVFSPATPSGYETFGNLRAHGCLDEETGAAARPWGELWAEQRIAEMERFGMPLGWLSVELNDVQRTESGCGHGAVTAALATLARTLQSNLSPADVLTRWDRAAFRVSLHNCAPGQLAEVSRSVARLAQLSEFRWWGERIPLAVRVRAVLAHPGDTLATLEARLSGVLS